MFLQRENFENHHAEKLIKISEICMKNICGENLKNFHRCIYYLVGL